MSDIPIVVEGAQCKCQNGSMPDKIKVLSHTKEYANDGKLIATTMEIGAATLEKNTFGNCPLMGSPPPPCKPVITEWQNYYEPIVLDNGGNIITEKSKGVCAISGAPCIEFIDNGQTEALSSQNIDNADEEVQTQLNPLVNIESIHSTPSFKGIIIQGKEVK